MGRSIYPPPGMTKPMQRGVISCAANSITTATVAAVNPSKTRLRFNGLVPSDAGGTIRLVNSTTIEVDATGNASAGKVAYELEETY